MQSVPEPQTLPVTRCGRWEVSVSAPGALRYPMHTVPRARLPWRRASTTPTVRCSHTSVTLLYPRMNPRFTRLTVFLSLPLTQITKRNIKSYLKEKTFSQIMKKTEQIYQGLVMHTWMILMTRWTQR
ncbi:poly(A) binding protein interacting protein 1 [Phyllostomus discolor]|uniref:Poly(A) binding protein interacting protein 1 n=1 Tax=Phyllostomus discolor TaxID=89673 RepID=A0A834EQU3_9CHIR|nr:poly(A) binding protein interacting protein 1 [Phyllostomus discolor]